MKGRTVIKWVLYGAAAWFIIFSIRGQLTQTPRTGNGPGRLQPEPVYRHV